MGNNVTKLYSVGFDHDSRQEFLDITRYIAQELHAEASSAKLIRTVFQRLKQLRQFPESCPPSTTYKFAKKAVRKLVVGNYLLFYMVDKRRKRVSVVKVIHHSLNK